MGTIKRSIGFPLDEAGFLRRECPFCGREFKIAIPPEDRTPDGSSVLESFMVSQDDETAREQGDEHKEFHCPYCGQMAARDNWFTQEQVACIHTALRNIMADTVNENLIKPLKRSLGRPEPGPLSIKFEGREIDKHEEWLSPEPNDMTRFLLPCCDRDIKIPDDWAGPVHCFFCGFPHRSPGPADRLAE